MKMLNEEQFNEIMADLAEVIGAINTAKSEFDAQKMRQEIVRELKEYLSTKNSLFKSLEKESLELEQNLDVLKNVKRHFEECKNKSEIRLIAASVSSMFVGSVITIMMMWFMGKFG